MKVKTSMDKKMIIQETKYQEAAVNLLGKILGDLTKQAEKSNAVFIENQQPKDAIPVILTTADRKRFYAAVTAAIASGAPPNPTRKNLEGLGDLAVGTSEVEVVIPGKTTSIRIRADIGNTGIIFVGKTGVLSDGSNDFARLPAGDEIVISYDDSDNPIFLISDTAAQAVNIGALL